MIDLHYWPTPNGKKVTILLEECGMPYRVVPCNIGRGDQFTPEFLKINPNNRMPAMVDDEPLGDMICYPLTIGWQGQGQDINEFPYFKRWFEELGARPAVQRGMAVGSDMTQDFSKLSPEEIDRLRKMLYNQRARPAPAGGLLK